MKKGRSIHSLHIGILSSQGVGTIPVYSVPVVAIVATGDELVPVGTPPEPGKICGGNGPLFAARIRELGMKPFLLQRGGGDTEKLAEEIRGQLTECDALIIGGGISVGVWDYIPYVAEAFGADVLLHGINVKPGSPILVMIVEGKSVLCLSGNPSVVAATFEVLVRPMLERMRGKVQQKPEILPGIFKNLFPKASPCRRLVRGKVEGGRVWLPEGRHSSGMLPSMVGCDCLVDIPAGSSGLKAGEQVKVMSMWLYVDSLCAAETLWRGFPPFCESSGGMCLYEFVQVLGISGSGL